MKLLRSKAFTLVILATLARPAWSFNTDQHRAATARAANDLEAQGESPDIARFKGLIGEWSAGIGKWYIPRNGTPGEQLAHVLNQTADICTVPWNGGQFPQVYNRIFTRYAQRNYFDKTAGNEGAYVYIGTALHLIEDQASMPHGANVRHGACPSLTEGFDPDNFENEPLAKPVSVDRTNSQGNVAPLAAYLFSLRKTRSLTGDYSSPLGERYWLRNEELISVASFNPPKSATPYDGEAEPGEPLFGAYGGSGYQDVFHDFERAELYRQQGTQATDYAYFFLDNISKLLPPLVSGFSAGNSKAISENAGAQITFSIAENRTEYVDVDIYILETGQRIVTDTMQTALDGAESPSGVTATRNVGVQVAWLAQPIQLFETKNDLSLLPYHAKIAAYWDGKLASGPALPAGSYTLCLTVKDRNGNGGTCESRATIQIDNIPPELKATSGEGWLGNDVVTGDNNISIYAVDKPDGAASGLRSIAVYQAVNGQFVFWFWSDRPSFSARFPGHSWYFVNACDNAGNCTPMRFGVFDEDEEVPDPPAAPNNTQIPPNSQPGLKTPPLPKPPTGPRRDPNTPRKYPRPTPLPEHPDCVATGVGKCLPKPPGPPLPGKPLRCRWNDVRCFFEMIRNTPHDPNAMYGPDGSVTPGQLMTYTIEFENEGTGEALGVYIEDVLDPALDDTTLTLRDMQAVNYASGTQVSASFPWTYDAQTRTVTVFAGDAAARQGGRFVLELRLKADSPPGTVIRNQAVVFFPNALETTPTNTIISAVPLPTQLASVGISSETYLNVARLEARLSASAAAVSGQSVNFSLLSDSFTAVTDTGGTAAGPVLLSTAAGRYDLSLSYAGDGFYYSPSAANTDFNILKRGALLQSPAASSRLTEAVRLSLTLTDDRGQELERQADSGRTVYLEVLDDSGAPTPLASSLLSGASVNFEFSVPQPARLSWTLRARFDGDPYYAAASSTGTLQLIDTTAPTVSIQSPSGGAYYEGQSFMVAFTVSDDADPAPTAYGALVNEDGAVPVQSGESIPVSSLSAGNWRLLVTGTDWVGNIFQAEGAEFRIEATLPDTTPPSLDLTPAQGSTIAVAMPTIAAQYGDADNGIDPTSARLALDGVDVTTSAVVNASSATFTPGEALAQGTHTVTAQVADFAGNLSSAAATFLVDSVPPVTQLLVNGLPASSTSLVVITTDTLSFAAADSGTGVLETRYSLDGGELSLVDGSTFSLAGGTHTLSFLSRDRAGNVESPLAIALTVRPDDQTPPALSLAPPDGAVAASVRPAVVASYADSTGGVNLASIRLTLDGVDVTTQAAVTSSSAAFVPISDLSQGTHTATAEVSDLAGNIASSTSTFLVDSLTPVTTLLVNGLPAGSTSLVVLSTDTAGFSASDAGSGVLETLYSVDGASDAVFVAAFTLSPGVHSLAFRSRDRAGNLETAQTASITVTSPSSDTTPPLVRLDFPGGAPIGVEQAIGGVVDVRGEASDASVLTWILETAPGASATSGFTTIASGAGNVSGLIAAWNSASLSGYQTLRLRAADAFGNAAQATVTAFVGNPAFAFAMGRKDADVIVATLKNPTGIAARADGLLWVAIANEDKLLLLDDAGVVHAEVGSGHGQGDAPSFKNPQGLALDAAGNLYVADKGNDRIVKLSPSGAQLALSLGKVNKKGKPQPGSGPGELRQPWDVAVDGNGDLFVADSGNRRIVVFDASGAYLSEFGAGVFLSTSQIHAVALTSAGLWVSDKELEVIHLFSRAGLLLKTIGGADSVVGEISRTRGLASDAQGNLYVIEPNRDRVQKFDPQGRGLLAFGTRAQATPAERAARRWLTMPLDAAVAPDGSLWVTDTGRDRIVRYALAAAGGYGVAALTTGGGESSSSAEPARRVIDHKDGAAVLRDDGSGVRVPKGALGVDLEITVEKGDENQDKEQKTAKRRELKITAVSEEVQYGPEGTTFSAPVTLTLPYDAGLIAAQGLKEDDLKVYYWNPTLKDWQAMPSTVDKQSKTVSALTNHFSAYQVGGLGGIGVAAIDDFGLRDGYAFPNPSRNGSAVTFRMQPGSVDSIEVRIYDVSGRKIHSSSDFRFRGAIDDGNGKGVQNTYDHNWDVSGVGSGVYTFVMTAKKAGQTDIRKTGKVGVIK